MALATLRDIHLAFGGPPLLDGVGFSIEKGERVCLIGRNGEGKSSLLKLMAGQIRAESGDLELRQGARVAYLDQDVPAEISGSVFQVVAQDACGQRCLALVGQLMPSPTISQEMLPASPWNCSTHTHTP